MSYVRGEQIWFHPFNTVKLHIYSLWKERTKLHSSNDSCCIKKNIWLCISKTVISCALGIISKTEAYIQMVLCKQVMVLFMLNTMFHWYILFNFMLKILYSHDEEPRNLSREGRENTVRDETNNCKNACIVETWEGTNNGMFISVRPWRW